MKSKHNRTKAVLVKMTVAERAMIGELAAKSGRKVATYLREHGLQKASVRG